VHGIVGSWWSEKVAPLQC